MRIVSLLPSTTEILFALGAGEDVVGVTFECDHPAEARTRRIVSTSAMPEGLGSTEIDAWVSAAMARGEDLYHLDAGALADLDADLVVTQDLCAVCAVDTSVVDEALAHLGCTAQVLTIDPHTLEEVIGSVACLGEATGTAETGAVIVADLRDRLARVDLATRGLRRRRVAVLEWTDPPYAPGHWVPEMVEAAGGRNVLGTAGEKSVRVLPEQVLAAGPDVIVCAPCGFDLDAASSLAEQVVAQGWLPTEAEVWAVDANAAYARPGPRLVDGIESLAVALHPGLAGTLPDPSPARRIR
ncbi:cobalamin-binding protein [Nocardioidaceae bacterium]|nr:cobalamin-binding protein [Nocardioidaceae bacterium]